VKLLATATILQGFSQLLHLSAKLRPVAGTQSLERVVIMIGRRTLISAGGRSRERRTSRFLNYRRRGGLNDLRQRPLSRFEQGGQGEFKIVPHNNAIAVRGDVNLDCGKEAASDYVGRVGQFLRGLEFALRRDHLGAPLALRFGLRRNRALHVLRQVD